MIENSDLKIKIYLELRGKESHYSCFNLRLEMSDNDHISPVRSGASKFATTHWSVVLSAVDSSSPQYKQSLKILCQTYWFPLYAYLRRHGYNTHEAQDCTQDFFMNMIEKDSLRLVNPDRGKFRSYILSALKHFMADRSDRARARKRGGGKTLFSLDLENAEDQYELEPVDQLSPERLFERMWALTLLQKAMNRLETEFSSMEKQKVFEQIVIYLAPAQEALSYHETAAKVDMTEGAVKVAVHRLRKRYQELLREEIAQTVSTEGEIDEEIQELFTALSY
jgi:RNA polymerase sigma factor (sigma-70 family)